MPELNIWLDTYDAIYSDFDNRHYQKRRISEDLLHKLRIEMKYTESHAADIILQLPSHKRNHDTERIVADSLADFFSGQYEHLRGKCRRKLDHGILLFITGIIIMLLNSWLSYYSGKTFLFIGLKVLLEPAGWFLVWAAFDLLYYDYTEIKRERNFYKELNEMEIHFRSS